MGNVCAKIAQVVETIFKKALPPVVQYVVNHPIRTAGHVLRVSMMLAPVLAGPLLGAVGFGANGIIGGSVAAGVQSLLGSGPAGGIFATLQSAGAGGYGVAVVSGVANVVGVAGGIAGGGSEMAKRLLKN